MNAQRFTAQVEARPRGSIAIRMPFDPSLVWGDKDRHHVVGTIEGRRLRGALVPTAPGAWHLLLGPTWCRDRRLEDGERVSVVLEPEGPSSIRWLPTWHRR